MTHLVVNDSMQAVLSQAEERVELRDAAGKLLGFFTPASLGETQAALESLARAYLAELHRRAENQEGGRTTREVFEQLLSLTPDEPMRAYLQKKIEGIKERDRCPTP